MLTHDEFKSRDHFDQSELLAFAYGRLIKDPPEGFRARLPVPPMLMLDRIENVTDEQASVLYRTLFSIEDEWPPVQVVFLYRVLDKTSGIADRAQRVGSRLQLMLAR